MQGFYCCTRCVTLFVVRQYLLYDRMDKSCYIEPNSGVRATEQREFPFQTFADSLFVLSPGFKPVEQPRRSQTQERGQKYRQSGNKKMLPGCLVPKRVDRSEELLELAIINGNFVRHFSSP